jgi:8-oxo-dGTP pyrophosphatase MutT (NUDIX family)
MFVISKDLDKGSTHKLRGLKFSRYKIPNLRDILDKIPSRDYILGVTYKQGDSQIFISGKAKIGENQHQGAQRELGEELGLKARRMYSYNTDTYIVDINDCKTCRNPEMPESDEDSDIHVYICVHGDRESILGYINKVSLGLNEDGITHIWSAKASEVIQNLDYKSRSQL